MARGGGRDTVVLVDPLGTVIGDAPKLEAHRPPGLLHLAVSVFLYRSDGDLLLQRRALSKYHFPGVWANACCSHPQPGESAAVAAKARVFEELGLGVELAAAGVFTYRAPCPDSGLVEHEFDAVFVGVTDAAPVVDPAEVAEFCYVGIDVVRRGAFTGVLAPWFAPALELAELARAASSSARGLSSP